MLRHELPKNFDPQTLARQQAKVAGFIPLASLKRLPLWGREGVLKVELTFILNEERLARVSGRVQGELSLECQRCLGTVVWALDQALDVVIVRTDEQAKAWLNRSEFWLLSPDKIEGEAPLWDCIEEEVLLALPLFAKHEPACPNEELR